MKSDNIELTVVMPSYNRGKYIREAVESVLSQKTSFEFVLIIADDGSTDNTIGIVEEYTKKYPDKIKALYSEKNQGLLRNILRVYSNLKTKYFCFLDADDYYVDKLFFQKAYDFLENNDEYVIYGGNTRILKDDNLENCTFHSISCKNEMTIKNIGEMYDGNFKYVTNTIETVFRNVLYSKGIPKIINDALGTPAEESFREDTARYIMHLKYGYAKFVNDVVGVYRQHRVGIWSLTTKFHKDIFQARAQYDYCRYYEYAYKEQFYKYMKKYMVDATNELTNMVNEDNICDISKEDFENYHFILKELKKYTAEENKEKPKRYDDKLLALLTNTENRKFVIWGTGKCADELVEKYGLKDGIIGYIDNNSKRWGEKINGIKVISPKEIVNIKDKKYIIIASSYAEEIINQILEFNLCEEEEIVNLFRIDCKYIKTFES